MVRVLCQGLRGSNEVAATLDEVMLAAGWLNRTVLSCHVEQVFHYDTAFPAALNLARAR